MDARQEFQDLCDKMAEEIVKPFTVQKEFIYIDSDLLYDYKLGAILAHIRSENDYDYIRGHLKEYLEAPTLECGKFFPDLNISEEEIEKTIKDPKNYIFLNAASPATTFIKDIGQMIRIFNTLNKSKDVKNPVTITINQKWINIHPKYRQGLVDMIHEVDPTINVEFTNYKSWYEVPEKLIERQDFICVYDMIEFLAEGTNSQKLLASVPPKLSKASIVTLTQSTMKNPTEENFKNLKVMLEVMCDKFSFIPKTILVKED